MSLTDLNDQGRFSHSAVCVHGQEELAYVHGELVFTQLIDQLPMHTFRRCIQRYGGNQYVKRFTC